MIPATHITIDGDTAWLVVQADDDLEVGLVKINDRPCDTCDGFGWGEDSGGIGGRERCPDCIDGRHTFEIAVADERRPWPEHHKTYRVAIVPGMVHPVVDHDRMPDDSYVNTLGNVWEYGYGRDGEPEWTLIDHATLPPAAAPGMWCIQLKVATP